MTERGSSLLETVAALSIGSLFAATALLDARTSLSVLTAARERSDALTVARNIAESLIGAPCAPGAERRLCPPALTCSLVRSPLTLAPGPTARRFDRLTITVATAEGNDSLAELSVIVEPVAPTTCGASARG